MHVIQVEYASYLLWLPEREEGGHGMITVTNMPEWTTHQLWLPEQEKEWTWDDQHHQSPTCQNVQLTFYDCQSRTKNGHGMISMIILTNMPECTTDPLWLPEQNKEWAWNDQHDQSLTCQNAQLTCYHCQSRTHNRHGIMSMISHKNSRMHNLPTMIARAGQTMDMG